jgi:hypothetical protein
LVEPQTQPATQLKSCQRPSNVRGLAVHAAGCSDLSLPVH